MLSAKKVQIFKEYGGDYDGYYRRNKPDLMDGSDWYMLRDLLSELYLIRKGRAAKSFEISIIKKLKENCDSEETMKSVFDLELHINRE